ncbi:MAG: hypothetical protein K2G70_05960 [Turicibacter sp.]|nr:hypothetical protein [Turicibacter sp.]
MEFEFMECRSVGEVVEKYLEYKNVVATELDSAELDWSMFAYICDVLSDDMFEDVRQKRKLEQSL